MAKLKENQNKYTLCWDCCGLLLIPPLHYRLSHTEPTPKKELGEPPKQPPSLLSMGGKGTIRKRMGWDGMGWDEMRWNEMGRKNNTVFEPTFSPGPRELFVWLPNTFVRSRKRIQIKQKSRRPRLITIGAQHNLVPAEHGLNLSSICFLGTPNKTRLSPLLLCVSPRFSPNGPLYVTPQKRRTWGSNTWKQMLMVTCYYPDNI